MTAAVIWLVVWLIVGIVLTWVAAAGTLLSFAYGVAEEKGLPVSLGVVFGIAGVGWTILWVSHVILQIISVVNIATGVSA